MNSNDMEKPKSGMRGGKINKKFCGNVIFKFGFRFFKKFMQDLIRKQPNEAEKTIEEHELIDMW